MKCKADRSTVSNTHVCTLSCNDAVMNLFGAEFAAVGMALAATTESHSLESTHGSVQAARFKGILRRQSHISDCMQRCESKPHNRGEPAVLNKKLSQLLMLLASADACKLTKTGEDKTNINPVKECPQVQVRGHWRI